MNYSTLKLPFKTHKGFNGHHDGRLFTVLTYSYMSLLWTGWITWYETRAHSSTHALTQQNVILKPKQSIKQFVMSLLRAFFITEEISPSSVFPQILYKCFLTYIEFLSDTHETCTDFVINLRWNIKKTIVSIKQFAPLKCNY